MIDKEKELADLLKISSLELFTEQESIDALLNLIEHSFDLKINTGTKHALALVKNIDYKTKFPTQRFLAHYITSVAWSDLRGNKIKAIEAWEWDQPDLEQEVVNVRLAARYFDRANDAPERLCQILSNLGGTMAWMGRYVMSYYYWSIVRAIDNNFGNAVGSFGDNMIYQSLNTLYDEGHQKIFFVLGYKNLVRAVKLPLEAGAREHYLARVESIERTNPNIGTVEFDLNTYEKYLSPKDELYRTWCLEHRLFLNPLNDLGEYGIATCDPLGLPTMTITTKEGTHSFSGE